jgi:hypothetical protein
MSITTVHTHRSIPSLSRRPVLDIMVENLARRLLAWSEHHQEHAVSTQLTHERMVLIRENERLRQWAGSPYGR